MTPTIPSSTINISVIPGTFFTGRPNNCLTRFRNLQRSTKHTFFSQAYILPLSTSARLFPQFRSGYNLLSKSRICIASAIGTDKSVEEQDSHITDRGTLGMLSNANDPAESSSLTSDTTPGTVRSKRSRPVRKSDMPPVKNEELILGATFTGKVRSIQPFGAFIDFGAFTDGLVHVSRLSDSFVKDVGSIVSVGQEVKVRLVEANTETGRISLTMRESDDTSKLQQQKDVLANSDKTRSSRGNASKPSSKKNVKKVSKFATGQYLEGAVKNITRSGAYISLPEGEEGFLPLSEEFDDPFASIMGNSSLQVGQNVTVRVLRIARAGVTLTMKKKEDAGELDSNFSQGVVHTATNPFVLAFRQNKDIASFLDEREKDEAMTENSVIQEASEDIVASKEFVGQPSAADQTSDSRESTDKLDVDVIAVDDNLTETTSQDEDSDSIIADQQVDEVVYGLDTEEIEDTSKTDSNKVVSDPSTSDETRDGAESSTKEVDAEVTAVVDTLTGAAKEVPESVVYGQPEALSAAVEDIKNDVERSSKRLPAQAGTFTAKDTVKTSPAIHEVESDEESEPTRQINGEILSLESIIAEDATGGQAEDLIADDEVLDEVEDKAPHSKVEVENVSSDPENNGTITGSNGQIDVPPPSESGTEATISPALVKQLRGETGAGMMDCKKALSETGGDRVKAQEFLRKKGLASAEKKASRATAEGRIGSYIHDSRIGVLIEVNCETDFVSRGDIFKELVDDLAMQVAACPGVQYLDMEDVPQEFVEKEREIEMQKEDLSSKPEQIRSKIVEGRIRKRIEELALLEQPYIKNDKVVVKDWVKQTIATIGENIKVKRFVRYDLGEGLEKRSTDFAAEVAAQSTAKPVSVPGKEQPAVDETKEAVEVPSKATISAALVKQLRAETGAGMMECKKALSETEGDLEKAQKYLRKRGLSAADKKSSRLAAEGRIGSYIHDSRIGVLVEVNCETDFVGRSEKFKELVDDLAMQVVACPLVQYVSIDSIPESIAIKEKELEMQREDLLSKPENVRGKIVDGRVLKRLGELALLEQPFIKNGNVLVKDLVKQTVAAIGENIKVRRFIRFTLGER